MAGIGKSENSVLIKFSTQNVKKVKDQTKEVDEGVQNLTDKIKKMGVALAGIFAVRKIFDVFIEQEKQLANFNNTMNNLVHATKEEYDALKEFSDFAQEKLGQDNDAVLGATTLIAQLTGSAKAANVLKESMVDLAVATGRGVQESAQMIARAVKGGLGAIRGLNVTQDISDQFDALGDDVEAKSEFIAKILKEKFGGAGASFGESFAGQIELMKNSIADFAKLLGAALAPVVQIVIKVATTILKWISPVIKVFSEGIKGITSSIPALIAILGGLGVAFLALKGPLIVAAIAGMWAGMMQAFATNPFFGWAIAGGVLAGIVTAGVGLARMLGGSASGSGFSGGGSNGAPPIPNNNSNMKPDINVNVEAYFEPDEMGNMRRVRNVQNSNRQNYIDRD